MNKSRLEAFSDAVIAIIITIMVLEMKVPHGNDFEALSALLPIFISYILSFIYIATYWNNHHHLLQASIVVNGTTLWANMHLLFWISLIPFTTAWMGENYFSSLPVALYGVVLFMAGFAYYILSNTLVRQHGENSVLADSLGRNQKGKISVIIYFLAIPLAFFVPWGAIALYVLVLIYWFIPERGIEKGIAERLDEPKS
jgi:uncharacterized membrane protein